MKIFSAWLLAFIFLAYVLAYFGPVFAHEDYSFPDASGAKVSESLEKNPIRHLPDKPYYLLITIKENFTRLSKPSAAKKAEFDMTLAGKRLREAYELLAKNDVKRSSKALTRYSTRLNEAVEQFEKARSQNQEVLTLSSKMANSLGTHETILSVLSEKWQYREDGAGFDGNFSSAFGGFATAVDAINNVQPGLKNRFISLDKEETIPSPIPSPTPVSTPSVSPRKIIY